MSEEIDEEKENWDFGGKVTVEKFALPCIRGNLQEVQRVHENGGGAVSMKFVKVDEPACEGVEAKCKNATLYE